MTCHHAPNDPNCTNHPNNVSARDVERRVAERLARDTPDSEKYQIVDVVRVGKNLVLKLLYPNCKKCSYEGNKVLVFLSVSEVEVLRWRKIDPHFRDPQTHRDFSESPGPNARFPASDEGWSDAIAYARSKSKT